MQPDFRSDGHKPVRMQSDGEKLYRTSEPNEQNERTMNNLNERTMQPSDLVVISSKRIEGAEPVEYWPGLFMIPTRIMVELTNAGRFYLTELCKDYYSDKVSVEELLSNVQTIANEFSGYVGDVEDKLWCEFNKISEQLN